MPTKRNRGGTNNRRGKPGAPDQQGTGRNQSDTSVDNSAPEPGTKQPSRKIRGSASKSVVSLVRADGQRAQFWDAVVKNDLDLNGDDFDEVLLARAALVHGAAHCPNPDTCYTPASFWVPPIKATHFWEQAGGRNAPPEANAFAPPSDGRRPVGEDAFAGSRTAAGLLAEACVLRSSRLGRLRAAGAKKARPGEDVVAAFVADVIEATYHAGASEADFVTRMDDVTAEHGAMCEKVPDPVDTTKLTYAVKSDAEMADSSTTVPTLARRNLETIMAYTLAPLISEVAAHNPTAYRGRVMKVWQDIYASYPSMDALFSDGVISASGDRPFAAYALVLDFGVVVRTFATLVDGSVHRLAWTEACIGSDTGHGITTFREIMASDPAPEMQALWAVWADTPYQPTCDHYRTVLENYNSTHYRTDLILERFAVTDAVNLARWLVNKYTWPMCIRVFRGMDAWLRSAQGGGQSSSSIARDVVDHSVRLGFFSSADALLSALKTVESESASDADRAAAEAKISRAMDQSFHGMHHGFLLATLQACARMTEEGHVPAFKGIYVSDICLRLKACLTSLESPWIDPNLGEADGIATCRKDAKTMLVYTGQQMLAFRSIARAGTCYNADIMRPSSALFNQDTGTGKTEQVIGVIMFKLFVAFMREVLIIVPDTVVEQTKARIRQYFSVLDGTHCVWIVSTHQVAAIMAGVGKAEEAPASVPVNWGVLTSKTAGAHATLTRILSLPAMVLIVDEVHIFSKKVKTYSDRMKVSSNNKDGKVDWALFERHPRTFLEGYLRSRNGFAANANRPFDAQATKDTELAKHITNNRVVMHGLFGIFYASAMRWCGVDAWSRYVKEARSDAHKQYYARLTTTKYGDFFAATRDLLGNNPDVMVEYFNRGMFQRYHRLYDKRVWTSLLRVFAVWFASEALSVSGGMQKGAIPTILSETVRTMGDIMFRTADGGTILPFPGQHLVSGAKSDKKSGNNSDTFSDTDNKPCSSLHYTDMPDSANDAFMQAFNTVNLAREGKVLTVNIYGVILALMGWGSSRSQSIVQSYVRLMQRAADPRSDSATEALDAAAATPGVTSVPVDHHQFNETLHDDAQAIRFDSLTHQSLPVPGDASGQPTVHAGCGISIMPTRPTGQLAQHANMYCGHIKHVTVAFEEGVTVADLRAALLFLFLAPPSTSEAKEPRSTPVLPSDEMVVRSLLRGSPLNHCVSAMLASRMTFTMTATVGRNDGGDFKTIGMVLPTCAKLAESSMDAADADAFKIVRFNTNVNTAGAVVQTKIEPITDVYFPEDVQHECKHAMTLSGRHLTSAVDVDAHTKAQKILIYGSLDTSMQPHVWASYFSPQLAAIKTKVYNSVPPDCGPIAPSVRTTLDAIFENLDQRHVFVRCSRTAAPIVVTVLSSLIGNSMTAVLNFNATGTTGISVRLMVPVTDTADVLRPRVTAADNVDVLTFSIKGLLAPGRRKAASRGGAADAAADAPQTDVVLGVGKECLIIDGRIPGTAEGAVLEKVWGSGSKKVAAWVLPARVSSTRDLVPLRSQQAADDDMNATPSDHTSADLGLLSRIVDSVDLPCFVVSTSADVNNNISNLRTLEHLQRTLEMAFLKVVGRHCTMEDIHCVNHPVVRDAEGAFPSIVNDGTLVCRVPMDGPTEATLRALSLAYSSVTSKEGRDLLLNKIVEDWARFDPEKNLSGAAMVECLNQYVAAPRATVPSVHTPYLIASMCSGALPHVPEWVMSLKGRDDASGNSSGSSGDGNVIEDVLKALTAASAATNPALVFHGLMPPPGGGPMQTDPPEGGGGAAPAAAAATALRLVNASAREGHRMGVAPAGMSLVMRLTPKLVTAATIHAALTRTHCVCLITRSWIADVEAIGRVQNLLGCTVYKTEALSADGALMDLSFNTFKTISLMARENTITLEALKERIERGTESWFMLGKAAMLFFQAMGRSVRGCDTIARALVQDTYSDSPIVSAEKDTKAPTPKKPPPKRSKTVNKKSRGQPNPLPKDDGPEELPPPVPRPVDARVPFRSHMDDGVQAEGTSPTVTRMMRHTVERLRVMDGAARPTAYSRSVPKDSVEECAGAAAMEAGLRFKPHLLEACVHTNEALCEVLCMAYVFSERPTFVRLKPKVNAKEAPDAALPDRIDCMVLEIGDAKANVLVTGSEPPPDPKPAGGMMTDRKWVRIQKKDASSAKVWVLFENVILHVYIECADGVAMGGVKDAWVANDTDGVFRVIESICHHPAVPETGYVFEVYPFWQSPFNQHGCIFRTKVLKTRFIYGCTVFHAQPAPAIKWLEHGFQAAFEDMCTVMRCPMLADPVTGVPAAVGSERAQSLIQTLYIGKDGPTPYWRTFITPMSNTDETMTASPQNGDAMLALLADPAMTRISVMERLFKSWKPLMLFASAMQMVSLVCGQALEASVDFVGQCASVSFDIPQSSDRAIQRGGRTKRYHSMLTSGMRFNEATGQTERRVLQCYLTYEAGATDWSRTLRDVDSDTPPPPEMVLNRMFINTSVIQRDVGLLKTSTNNATATAFINHVFGAFKAVHVTKRVNDLRYKILELRDSKSKIADTDAADDGDKEPSVHETYAVRRTLTTLYTAFVLAVRETIMAPKTTASRTAAAHADESYVKASNKYLSTESGGFDGLFEKSPSNHLLVHVAMNTRFDLTIADIEFIYRRMGAFIEADNGVKVVFCDEKDGKLVANPRIDTNGVNPLNIDVDGLMLPGKKRRDAPVVTKAAYEKTPWVFFRKHIGVRVGGGEIRRLYGVERFLLIASSLFFRSSNDQPVKWSDMAAYASLIFGIYGTLVVTKIEIGSKLNLGMVETLQTIQRIVDITQKTTELFNNEVKALETLLAANTTPDEADTLANLKKLKTIEARVKTAFVRMVRNNDIEELGASMLKSIPSEMVAYMFKRLQPHQIAMYVPDIWLGDADPVLVSDIVRAVWLRPTLEKDVTFNRWINIDSFKWFDPTEAETADTVVLSQSLMLAVIFSADKKVDSSAVRRSIEAMPDDVGELLPGRTVRINQDLKNIMAKWVDITFEAMASNKSDGLVLDRLKGMYAADPSPKGVWSRVTRFVRMYELAAYAVKSIVFEDPEEPVADAPEDPDDRHEKRRKNGTGMGGVLDARAGQKRPRTNEISVNTPLLKKLLIMASNVYSTLVAETVKHYLPLPVATVAAYITAHLASDWPWLFRSFATVKDMDFRQLDDHCPDAAAAADRRAASKEPVEPADTDGATLTALLEMVASMRHGDRSIGDAIALCVSLLRPVVYMAVRKQVLEFDTTLAKSDVSARYSSLRIILGPETATAVYQIMQRTLAYMSAVALRDADKTFLRLYAVGETVQREGDQLTAWPHRINEAVAGVVKGLNDDNKNEDDGEVIEMFIVKSYPLFLVPAVLYHILPVSAEAGSGAYNAWLSDARKEALGGLLKACQTVGGQHASAGAAADAVRALAPEMPLLPVYYPSPIEEKTRMFSSVQEQRGYLDSYMFGHTLMSRTTATLSVMVQAGMTTLPVYNSATFLLGYPGVADTSRGSFQLFLVNPVLQLQWERLVAYVRGGFSGNLFTMQEVAYDVMGAPAVQYTADSTAAEVEDDANDIEVNDDGEKVVPAANAARASATPKEEELEITSTHYDTRMPPAMVDMAALNSFVKKSGKIHSTDTAIAAPANALDVLNPMVNAIEDSEDGSRMHAKVEGVFMFNVARLRTALSVTPGVSSLAVLLANLRLVSLQSGAAPYDAVCAAGQARTLPEPNRSMVLLLHRTMARATSVETRVVTPGAAAVAYAARKTTPGWVAQKFKTAYEAFAKNLGITIPPKMSETVANAYIEVEQRHTGAEQLKAHVPITSDNFNIGVFSILSRPITLNLGVSDADGRSLFQVMSGHLASPHTSTGYKGWHVVGVMCGILHDTCLGLVINESDRTEWAPGEDAVCAERIRCALAMRACETLCKAMARTVLEPKDTTALFLRRRTEKLTGTIFKRQREALQKINANTKEVLLHILDVVAAVCSNAVVANALLMFKLLEPTLDSALVPCFLVEIGKDVPACSRITTGLMDAMQTLVAEEGSSPLDMVCDWWSKGIEPLAWFNQHSRLYAWRGGRVTLHTTTPATPRRTEFMHLAVRVGDPIFVTRPSATLDDVETRLLEPWAAALLYKATGPLAYSVEMTLKHEREAVADIMRIAQGDATAGTIAAYNERVGNEARKNQVIASRTEVSDKNQTAAKPNKQQSTNPSNY